MNIFQRVTKYLPNSVEENLIKAYFKVLTFRHVPNTKQTSQNFGIMKIRVLPALKDNYMYLIIDTVSKEAAVVDPVDPNTVLEAVRDEEVNLTSILITHHHWDHSGGNEELVKKVPGIKVYGGDKRISALTDQIGDNYKFNIGTISVTCLFTPCHTTGHVCYYVEPPGGNKTAVFTGDTLFIGGCGRFFEGNAQQMYDALIKKLGVLPGNTSVYCGHEATVDNLKFAAHVEPANNAITVKMDWAVNLRQGNMPTVPSTIEEEKLYNPYMRVMESSVQSHASTEDAIMTMAKIRKESDHFKR